MRWSTVALLSIIVVPTLSERAAAQFDEQLIPSTHTFISPEHFGFEFRIGPYHPNSHAGNDAFDAFYKNDDGPLIAFEFDVVALRVPDALYLGVGGGLGWMNFDGKTIAKNGQRASEDTSFEMIPLNLLGVARFDALARRLSIPFIITGKLGYQWTHWSTDSGGRTDGTGWSLGLLWGAQLALDLDFFEPAAARNMDEEWGINHSFLFFELMKFVPNAKSLPIGDLTWTAGLGFMF
jgi:hypothetical protein